MIEGMASFVGSEDEEEAGTENQEKQIVTEQPAESKPKKPKQRKYSNI